MLQARVQFHTVIEDTHLVHGKPAALPVISRPEFQVGEEVLDSVRQLFGLHLSGKPSEELSLGFIKVPGVVCGVDDFGTMQGAKEQSVLLQPANEGRDRTQAVVDEGECNQGMGSLRLLHYCDREPVGEETGRTIVAVLHPRQRIRRYPQLFPEEGQRLLCCLQKLVSEAIYQVVNLHEPRLDLAVPLHATVLRVLRSEDTVSEKGGVDYCSFKQTIASKAIIEKFP